jgi:hypothetical protein
MMDWEDMEGPGGSIESEDGTAEHFEGQFLCGGVDRSAARNSSTRIKHFRPRAGPSRTAGPQQCAPAWSGMPARWTTWSSNGCAGV